ncbi:MAG: leucine-rich repeat domain-containing protein, partial [Lachnospiraceae bacterium]|nr:leucine-rich repeat domain-containing protein [Lachnospiraceae bacterium]
MKKLTRKIALILVCCMTVNIIPVDSMSVKGLAAETDVKVRQVKQENPRTETAFTPISVEDETIVNRELPILEEGEVQTLTVAPHASGEGVYQEELKIWFDADKGIVTDADDDIKSLDLPQMIEGTNVKAIGDKAFMNCVALEKITLPKGLQTIGDTAFYRCEALSSIEIPESVSKIGDGAFQDCKKLDSIEIPENVSKIGWYTFYNCWDLRDVILPEGIEYIEDGAFSNCISLETIVIPDSTKRIGRVRNSAYDDVDSLAGYYYGGVFEGCSKLREVSLGNSLSVIGSSAFGNCTALEEIHLPDGLETAGGMLFERCTCLKKVYLPKSLQSISWMMFRGCTALEEIDIPEGVTEIQFYAFEGCLSLSSVTIPESVVSIGKGYRYVGWDYIAETCGGAFSGCPSLTYITIPETVTKIYDREDRDSSYSGWFYVNFDTSTILRVKEDSRAERYAVSHNLNYIY